MEIVRCELARLHTMQNSMGGEESSYIVPRLSGIGWFRLTPGCDLSWENVVEYVVHETSARLYIILGDDE